MAKQLREVELEVNETIRIIGSNGRTFRVRLLEDQIRFVCEDGNAKIIEFYGRGDDSILGVAW